MAVILSRGDELNLTHQQQLTYSLFVSSIPDTQPSRWRYDRSTQSALLALCWDIHRSRKRSVMRNLIAFINVSQNMVLNKQSNSRWIETPHVTLAWRHCNIIPTANRFLPQGLSIIAFVVSDIQQFPNFLSVPEQLLHQNGVISRA